jgi:hypothetical protein
LIIAIIAAALAALGNAGVALVNGILSRAVEDRKAEANRILEMIKTGNREDAARNLQFLLETGLIAEQDTRLSIEAFLGARQPGEGPALPSPDRLSPSMSRHLCLDGKMNLFAETGMAVIIEEKHSPASCSISINGAGPGDREIPCRNLDNAIVYIPQNLVSRTTYSGDSCHVEVVAQTTIFGPPR